MTKRGKEGLTVKIFPLELIIRGSHFQIVAGPHSWNATRHCETKQSANCSASLEVGSETMT